MWRILFVGVVLNVCRAQLSIRSSSPPTGSVLPSSSTATLSCTSSVPWYICIWEGPGGIACQCQSQVGGVNALCQGYPRMSLTGGGNDCQATITGVSLEDAGQWRCVMVESNKFTSVSKTISLEVGQPALVTWTSLGSSLEVKENDNVKLECAAVGGYPEPVITMEGSNNLRIGRQESTPSRVGGLVDVRSTADYAAKLEDNNNKIACIATQLDKMGNLLYTTRADFSLAVAPVAARSALAIPIGGIIGIILAILLIFLLCAILACLLFRKRKRTYREYYEESTEAEEIKVTTTTDAPTIPIEHEVYVSGAEVKQINYEGNINQFFHSSYEKEKLLGEKNAKRTSFSENLEYEVFLNRGAQERSRRNSSSSSSSASSGDLKKGSLNKTESNKNNYLETVTAHTVNLVSTELSKHDSTFVYNGTVYREEVFEDHIEKDKSRPLVPQHGKFKNNKWKNNLTDIKEERSCQLRDSSTRQTFYKENTVKKDEEKVQTKPFDKEEYVFQKLQLENEEKQGRSKSEHTQSYTVPAEKIDVQIMKPKLEMTKHKSTVSNSKSLRNEIVQQETIHKDVLLFSSDDSDGKTQRTFQDEHYYIGDSEYADVVEEHVKGKYDDDLGYFESKSKENITVKPKVWTLEEIYYEEFKQQNTEFSMGHHNPPIILTEGDVDDQSKHEYIQNWISQENLQESSPTSDKSSFDQSRNLSFDNEQDRSDESIIVDIEVSRKKSRKSTSSNFDNQNSAQYEEISPNSTLVEKTSNLITKKAKHWKTENDSKVVSHVNKIIKNTVSEQAASVHLKNLKERSNVEKICIDQHSQPTYVPETKTKANYVDSAKDYERKVEDRKEIKGSLHERKTKQVRKENTSRFPGDILTTVEITQSPNSTNTCPNENKQFYKITQQEIIFYMKNKKGEIKIVHRPLLQSHTLGMSGEGEGQRKFLRHKSQPNLYSSHILRHMDSTLEDRQADKEAEEQMLDHGREDQHIHMENVGLLQQSLSMKQFMGLGTQLGSSGSIFDCEMKCFQDEEGNLRSPQLIV